MKSDIIFFFVVFLVWYPITKIIFRTTKLIFALQNWLWKPKLPNFWPLLSKKSFEFIWCNVKMHWFLIKIWNSTTVIMLARAEEWRCSCMLSFGLRGHSQIALRTLHYFLTTHLPMVTFCLLAMILLIKYHRKFPIVTLLLTTHPPQLRNVICERPLKRYSILKFTHKNHT